MLGLDRKPGGFVFGERCLGPHRLEEIESELPAERLLDDLAISAAGTGGAKLDCPQDVSVDGQGRSGLGHLYILASLRRDAPVYSGQGRLLVLEGGNEGCVGVDGRQVRVDVLDHRQGRVAQDLGDEERIHAAAEHVRRGSVAEDVRVDPLTDTGPLAEGADELLHPLSVRAS